MGLSATTMLAHLRGGSVADDWNHHPVDVWDFLRCRRALAAQPDLAAKFDTMRTCSGDEHDREAADCDELDDFDPWSPLRNFIAARDAMLSNQAPARPVDDRDLDNMIDVLTNTHGPHNVTVQALVELRVARRVLLDVDEGLREAIAEPGTTAIGWRCGWCGTHVGTIADRDKGLEAGKQHSLTCSANPVVQERDQLRAELEWERQTADRICRWLRAMDDIEATQAAETIESGDWKGHA